MRLLKGHSLQIRNHIYQLCEILLVYVLSFLGFFIVKNSSQSYDVKLELEEKFACPL